MNILLFFAFPIATIIFTIAIEKILKNPLLTAAVIFAIFLVVTFTAFDATFLIYAIVYSIIAFIVAIITRFILQFKKSKTCCQLETNNNTEDTLSLNTNDISEMTNEIKNIQNNTCNCNNTNNINSTTRGMNRYYYRR